MSMMALKSKYVFFKYNYKEFFFIGTQSNFDVIRVQPIDLWFPGHIKLEY